MAEVEKWQDEFSEEIDEMDNRELYEMFLSMLRGYYWDDEGLGHPDTDKDSAWMIQEVEDDLDWRLRDWFDEDPNDED